MKQLIAAVSSFGIALSVSGTCTGAAATPVRQAPGAGRLTGHHMVIRKGDVWSVDGGVSSQRTRVGDVVDLCGYDDKTACLRSDGNIYLLSGGTTLKPISVHGGFTVPAWIDHGTRLVALRQIPYGHGADGYYTSFWVIDVQHPAQKQITPTTYPDFEVSGAILPSPSGRRLLLSDSFEQGRAFTVVEVDSWKPVRGWQDRPIFGACASRWMSDNRLALTENSEFGNGRINVYKLPRE